MATHPKLITSNKDIDRFRAADSGEGSSRTHLYPDPIRTHSRPAYVAGPSFRSGSDPTSYSMPMLLVITCDVEPRSSIGSLLRLAALVLRPPPPTPCFRERARLRSYIASDKFKPLTSAHSQIMLLSRDRHAIPKGLESNQHLGRQSSVIIQKRDAKGPKPP